MWDQRLGEAADLNLGDRLDGTSGDQHLQESAGSNPGRVVGALFCWTGKEDSMEATLAQMKACTHVRARICVRAGGGVWGSPKTGR